MERVAWEIPNIKHTEMERKEIKHIEQNSNSFYRILLKGHSE